jgi:hypothetical protein
MGRLVLLLAVLLGWAAFGRRPPPPRRLYGSAPDAFPFPTGASRAGIDVDDPQALAEWCESLDCTEEQLRAAVRAAGRSPHAVRQHLSRPR